MRTATVFVAALIALVGAALATQDAYANDAAVGIGNFAESAGCSPNESGVARPYLSRTGFISPSEQIRGPWGDMFGRNATQIGGSIVDWPLPGSAKVLKVHERILPTLQLAEASLNMHLADGNSYYVYSGVARVYRTVGGSYRPSEHALGTAFDINPQDNPYSRDNYLRTDLPDWFVSSFVDAGFCWGGYWQTVKDAMHFSWSGPGQTPGYPSRPVPYAPLTSSTSFVGNLIGQRSALAVAAGATVTVADMTGEGAPDIVQILPSGLVEAAGAVGDYGTIAYRSQAGSGSSTSAIGDLDLDGVQDVWIADRGGPTIVLDVWLGTADLGDVSTIATGVPSTFETLLLGYFDTDLVPDIYAVGTEGVSIYGSQSSYMAVDATLPFDEDVDETWHFATGDVDVDGRADVYAISNGDAPTLKVSKASGGVEVFGPAVAMTVESQFEVADYDGDGRDDLFVLDGSELTIAVGGSSSLSPSSWFQNASSITPDAGPACNGGEPCDSIAHVDSGGVWTLADRPRWNPKETAFYYGNPGDRPFAGDWNCDGIDTPGLYRQSDGLVYLRETNTQGVADTQFFFGIPQDVPLVGDFNGDGCDTVSLYRPAENRLYIINKLGSDLGGLGAAEFYFTFGESREVPFVGDFDGDGADEIAVRDPVTARVSIKWELTEGDPDLEFVYGSPGDIPIAGDWDGDGTDTIGVYRPSNGIWYLRLSNDAGVADHSIRYRASGPQSSPVYGRFWP